MVCVSCDLRCHAMTYAHVDMNRHLKGIDGNQIKSNGDEYDIEGYCTKMKEDCKHDGYSKGIQRDPIGKDG